MTGIARYVRQLSRHLVNLGAGLRLIVPEPLPTPLSTVGSRAGLDLASFGATYPLRLVAPRLEEVDVYHLASQNLATLLLFQRFRRPVVVTVHDIIPYLTRNDPQLSTYRHACHRFFDRLAMWGLKRANLLLADSAWTKATLTEHLGIAAERIQVIYLGADAEQFRPMDLDDHFWRFYGLNPQQRHLLYVGSDDPRKNLENLLRAFSAVSRRRPELRLVRVGAAYRPGQEDRLAGLTRELGVGAKEIKIGSIPEDDLARFYSAADLVAVPSYYEGFGLPVLESLACGTRVVSSNTAALPEIAGADSILCSPSADAIERGIRSALDESARTARDARRKWAQQFTWTSTAEQVKRAYHRAGGLPA